ncbi:MAG: hypothetical protein ACR2QF_01990 [Geminicoccaceae bacterium]
MVHADDRSLRKTPAMCHPEIKRGDQELERFDDLKVSLVTEIELEREKQKTERLRLFKKLALLLVLIVLFGGALALGNDGLILLKDLMAEVLG